MLKKSRPPNFKDNRRFFEALKAHDAGAIRQLSEALGSTLFKLPGIYLLPKEDMEELRNDALLVTLKKLDEGAFQFQEYNPVSYAQAVARKLLANFLRKRKLDTVPLDDQDTNVDIDPEQYYVQKETETALGNLLKTLGDNCEQVIRLKYYDLLRDQEVVDRQLAPYSTVDSLKNKRSQCLKKLAALLRDKGLSFTQFLP